MRDLLAATAILLSCASASAQDRELVVVGFGASPCSDVLKHHQEEPKVLGLLLITYAQGFWTGQNAMFMQARAPTVKNLAGGSEAHLKNLMAECGRRPSEDFGIIIRDYFYKLPGLKAK